MKVRDRMSANPITVSLETTISEAMQLMRDNNIRRVPVMDRRKLVSIVTQKDLAEVSPSSATTLSVYEVNYLLAKTRIGDVINLKRRLITIEADQSIERAAVVMQENKIGAIPVLDQGKLVGIITETDIFSAFIEILGVNRPGIRIDLEVGEGVGAVARVTGIIANLGISIENIVLIREPVGSNYELILRLATQEADPVVDELKQQGFKVISVVRKLER
ncbi:MAG: CBS and ACT domain-containing protein [Chitinophagales bacterium]